MPSKLAPAERYAAFRHPSYVRVLAARVFTNLATQIVSVAVAWQIYDITRDPFALGLVGIVQFMPSLLLVLVTGAAADRFGRRLIMGLAICLEAICALALAVLTLAGSVVPLHVFAVLALFGVARAFLAPASVSLVANVVPKKDFANAVAWNSTAGQASTIVGPVAGGLLYGMGEPVPYFVALVLMSCAAVTVFAMPKPEQATSADTSLDTLFAGFRYIWNQKVVLGAISLDMFAVIVSGAVALLPVFARDILVLGPWSLGLLRAAPAFGAIAVSIWLAGHPMRDRAGAIMFVFVALFGVSTIVFGLSDIVWLSILALAAIGATDMVSVYVRATLIQIWTPDEVRGRVSAVNSVFIGASNELGEFRAGTMAALIGTVPAVVIGGAGAVAIAGIWSVLFPELRRIRRLDGTDR